MYFTLLQIWKNDVSCRQIHKETFINYGEISNRNARTKKTLKEEGCDVVISFGKRRNSSLISFYEGGENTGHSSRENEAKRVTLFVLAATEGFLLERRNVKKRHRTRENLKVKKVR